MRRHRWKQLESSSLQSVWYDRKRYRLYVTFNSGHRYMYYGVSYYRYRRLVKADSIGKYFYYNVRSNFECKKLKEEDIRGRFLG